MMYGKCSKILNTFLILFSHKMLFIRAGNHKMLCIIANGEDLDQTASSVFPVFLSLFARQLVLEILEHLL